MKKYLMGIFCLLALSSSLKAQTTVSILIDAGLLKNSTGTANVPVGGLLQLIASSSGSFTAPTPSSYVGGDSTNVVLANFAMNYSSRVDGETVNNLNNLTLPSTVTAGQKLLLRFYPSLTLASMPASPTLGTSFGQVRSDTIEFGSAGGDGNETIWVAPAAGRSVDLNYITMNDGGTYANSTAYATGVVMAVPEPSITGIIGGVIIGVVGLAKLRRRAA